MLLSFHIPLRAQSLTSGFLGTALYGGDKRLVMCWRPRSPGLNFSPLVSKSIFQPIKDTHLWVTNKETTSMSFIIFDDSE